MYEYVPRLFLRTVLFAIVAAIAEKVFFDPRGI